VSSSRLRSMQYAAGVISPSCVTDRPSHSAHASASASRCSH